MQSTRRCLAAWNHSYQIISLNKNIRILLLILLTIRSKYISSILSIYNLQNNFENCFFFFKLNQTSTITRSVIQNYKKKKKITNKRSSIFSTSSSSRFSRRIIRGNNGAQQRKPLFLFPFPPLNSEKLRPRFIRIICILRDVPGATIIDEAEKNGRCQRKW